MKSSNDPKTNLRYGAIARATDAASLALALKLIGELREGSPIELGDLAELLGPRAPGRKCAGGPGQRGATNAPASQGHLDAILRALPRLVQDRVIVFHSPLTLDPAGRAVGGTRDRMPLWEFEPTLETAGRPPRSERALRFAEQVERAGLGYTIVSDAWRLALAADASGRITGAIGELAEITARSKDATLRTLETLAAADRIGLVSTGRRPIIFHVVLGGDAGADSSLEAVPEPVSSAAEFEATMLPEPAVVEPAADVATVETRTTADASPDPVGVIEIAPTRILFPHLFKDYRDRVEEFFAERMTADAVAALRRDAVEIERACFEQEEWVRKVLDAAYEGLAVRMGRLATLRESQMDYIAGIIRNNSFDLQFKKLAAGRDPSELRAEQEANRAEAHARQLLQRCSALNNNGEQEAAREILTDELEPLAPKLAPLFDNDPIYAGAMLRLAFKQGADWIIGLEPDEFALNFDPAWQWPADLPTFRQRRSEQAA